jgi:hypothetical protein
MSAGEHWTEIVPQNRRTSARPGGSPPANRKFVLFAKIEAEIVCGLVYEVMTSIEGQDGLDQGSHHDGSAKHGANWRRRPYRRVWDAPSAN